MDEIKEEEPKILKEKPKVELPKIKEKNPNRVAAGKRLQEFRKLEREKVNRYYREIEESKPIVDKSFNPILPITLLIVVVGGLYLYNNQPKPQPKSKPIIIEQDKSGPTQKPTSYNTDW